MVLLGFGPGDEALETGLPLVGISLVALVLSYVGVAGLRHLVEQRRLLDIPNERSSHSQPTPRGGGLVIVFVTIIGAAAFWLVKPVWPLTQLLSLISGAVLVAGVSWLDDLHPLPRRIRFAVHISSAAIAVVGIGYGQVVQVPLDGRLDLGWIGIPVTFLWIVGLTNAYNFMDGIDGLAGGQGVIAGLGWGVLGWLSDQSFVAVIGTLLAAGSLGFLGHNWPPARIFMGDVGSTFMGFAFAVLAVAAAQTEPILAWAGVFLLWPFLFDTSLTFMRRLLNGENVFAAHRSHLYQRLVIAGLSHKRVSSLYIGLAIVGGVWAVAITQEWPVTSIIGILVILFSCLGLWWGVRWREQQAPRASTVERAASERR